MAFRESMHWASAEATLMKNISFETIFGIAALLAVILITGYLIIYSIFQISVSQDIRYYGLLKTIGVTRKQLRHMLVMEGILYTAGAGVISAVLSIALYPFAVGALTRLFWFASPHFSLLPVFFAIPVYILMGWLIPRADYGSSVKESIVDKIRELG